MSESFNSIATEILRDSISTALYIDDEALEPFEEKKSNLVDFSYLFESFKKSNCLLDIRRYEHIRNENKYKKLMQKTDLLIMDWQLQKSDIENKIPLKLLSKAISINNLHFICIYTKRDDKEIDEEILYPITGHYSNLNIDSKVLELFLETLNEYGIEKNDFKNKIEGKIKEITFNYYQKKDISSLINELEETISKLGILDEFREYLNTNFSDLLYEQRIIRFGYNYLGVLKLSKSYLFEISRKDKYTIYIDNTIIKIRRKINKKLCEDFCESIINDQNIFFTLFGLELKRRLKKSAAFIGSEIGKINEITLFYHQKRITVSEFSEFLLNIWKEQSSSIIYERDIKLFDALNDYKSKRNITRSISNFRRGDENNQIDLSVLNIFYNCLSVNRKSEDNVRFGDIFKIKYYKKFLLCITPHCDCLRPKEKIDNMFQFVEGEFLELKDGLKKSESKFISFLDYNNIPICIKWICKPFTIYISDNKNHLNSLDNLIIKNSNRSLLYISTLRENYAQRISNESFGNPLRVGITFA